MTLIVFKKYTMKKYIVLVLLGFTFACSQNNEAEVSDDTIELENATMELENSIENSEMEIAKNQKEIDSLLNGI